MNRHYFKTACRHITKGYLNAPAIIAGRSPGIDSLTIACCKKDIGIPKVQGVSNAARPGACLADRRRVQHAQFCGYS